MLTINNAAGILTKLVFTVILLGFILWASQGLSEQQGEDKTQDSLDSKPEKLIVRGAIVTDDGSPAAGVVLYIFPYKEGGMITMGIKMEDGKVRPSQNPRCKTDKEGRFTIQFSRNFLKEEADQGEFCIGAFDGGPQPLKVTEPIVANVRLNMSLFDTKGELDINKLFKKIVIIK